MNSIKAGDILKCVTDQEDGEPVFEDEHSDRVIRVIMPGECVEVAGDCPASNARGDGRLMVRLKGGGAVELEFFEVVRMQGRAELSRTRLRKAAKRGRHILSAVRLKEQMKSIKAPKDARTGSNSREMDKGGVPKA